MKDKYNLSKEENIFLAKKLMSESIFHGAKLEGSNITFPETQTILDGVNVPGATIDDIQTILNLRDAWRHLITTYDEPFSLAYVMKINSLVARNESLEWGVLRTGNVGISGTPYKPKIPEADKIKKDFRDILNETDSSVTKKAIHLFLYCSRSQMFWDGNKRTSLLCANKILINEGKGIFTVPETILFEFNKKLTHFYETNDYTVIDDFLYSNCIKGIDYPRQTNTLFQKPNNRTR